MRVRLAITAALLLCAAGRPAGQTAPAASQTLSIVVTGRVLAAAGRVPLAHARIVPPTASPDRPFVFSDDEGRFTVRGPLGAAVTVSKAGYMPRALAIARGGDAEVVLDASGALSGRVISADGEGFSGVLVTVDLRPGKGADPAFVSAQTSFATMVSITDDRGEYRIAPAPVVPFTVKVELPSGLETRTLPNGARISSLVIARTFFPNTQESGEATVFTLHPGDDQGGVNFVTLPPFYPLFDPTMMSPLPAGTASVSRLAFLRVAVSDREERFAMSGLPAETYYLAAVLSDPGLGPDAWQDPEYLESLLGRATTVTLSEGLQTTTTLRLPARESCSTMRHKGTT